MIVGILVGGFIAAAICVSGEESLDEYDEYEESIERENEEENDEIL